MCNGCVCPDWVISLGPVQGEDQMYSYAVMTDPQAQGLYVLARNVRGFEHNYEVQVIASLLDAGFNTANTMPAIVFQDTSCKYPSAPQDLEFPCKYTTMYSQS